MPRALAIPDLTYSICQPEFRAIVRARRWRRYRPHPRVRAGAVRPSEAAWSNHFAKPMGEFQVLKGATNARRGVRAQPSHQLMFSLTLCKFPMGEYAPRPVGGRNGI